MKMKLSKFKGSIILLVLCALIFSSAVLLEGSASAENIDPDNDGSQYSYGENVGWLNAEPSGDGGPGVQVESNELTGYIWGENIGWISVSCVNTGNCGTVNYSVVNDGAGNLSGYAWGENVGWISFSCANTNSCETANYGVKIDPNTGAFSGYAWSENIGWINFAPSTGGAKTSWRGEVDNCPSDPDKTEPGICGCGVADIDSDRDGYYACINDCNDTDANINPAASDITCNGIDENCSGTPDEGYTATPTICDIGACQASGSLICSGGILVDTCTPDQPQTEGPYGSPTCSDSIDNDCDGLTDGGDPDCAVANLPDLTGWWTSMKTKQVTNGWFVTGTLNVTNQGNADAGSFGIKYYYIPSGGGSRRYLTKIRLTDLLQGAATDVILGYLFTSNPSGGDILAVIDTNNTVAESNETNNRAKRRIP